jgi:uncharacterized protein (TIGR02246 family)
MRSIFLALAGVLLALPAAALAQDYSDTEAAIRKAAAEWEAAFNAGDGAAVAALYSYDATILPDGAEPVNGREGIAEFWTTAAAEGATDEIKTVEIFDLGDMAVEVGTYKATAADGTHLDHGKYMVLHKKVDGEWKLYRDIWNSSMTP